MEFIYYVLIFVYWDIELDIEMMNGLFTDKNHRKAYKYFKFIKLTKG